MIEDKTFGLKNKGKSKKVQQEVKKVHNSVNQIHDKQAKKEAEEKGEEENTEDVGEAERGRIEISVPL